MIQTRFGQSPDQPQGPTPTLEEALAGPLLFLPSYLTPSQMTRWKREMRSLAGEEGGREAAGALLRRAHEVARRLAPRDFMRWSRFVRTALALGPEVATAFGWASPEVLAKAGAAGFQVWMGNVERFLKAGDLTAEALTEFLQASPRLAAALPQEQVGALLELLAEIPARPSEMALSAVQSALSSLTGLGTAERTETLAVGRRIAQAHPWVIATYFQTVARLAPRMGTEATRSFVQALGDLTTLSPLQFSGFLKDVTSLPKGLTQDQAGVLLPAVARLASQSVGAAQELLSSGPTLFQRLTPDQLAAWYKGGEELLRNDEGAAVSYFRLQSRRSREALASMSVGVALEEVRDVLQLYSQALMGRNISIVGAEGPDGRTPAWFESEELGLDAPTIFAPSLMQGYPAKALNFEAYKVLITHQTGHITFGTYDFSFDREGNVFRSLRGLIAGSDAPAALRESQGTTLGEGRGEGFESPGGLGELQRAARVVRQNSRQVSANVPSAPTGDLDRFFSLFQERRLARDLFTLADDERIDAVIRSEYRGIRRPFERVQAGSLEGRPQLDDLALREYLFELLVRHSLGHYGPYRVPERLVEPVTAAAGMLNLLSMRTATVEDIAEAAARLYILLRQVPNIPVRLLPREGWVEVRLDEAGYDPDAEDLAALLQQFARVDPQSGPFPGDDEGETEDEEEEDEQPFMPPPPVPHRGDHQPELMQLMMNVRDRGQGQPEDDDTEPTTAELIQELMDREQEEGLDLEENEEGVDHSSALSRYLRALAQREPAPDRPSPIIESVAEDDVQVFHYDEWDYRTKTFRAGWCELHQRTLKEGPGESYAKTLQEHQWLAHAVRKQFEMLRPEGMGRVKRLLDGEEFDLDAVVESVVDKKAGDGLKDKVYWRRRKNERSVSVALLLDMSLSTDERIDQDVRFFSAQGSVAPEQTARHRPGSGKRIIDLEKESLVLLIEALEQLGDEYGIYGFSSAGRGDIQYFIIKELAEASSFHIRNRLDKIVPLQGTRMGAAIRHTASKLDGTDAHTKVLLMLTDGRPQDRGYGTLPWELEDPNKGRYHPLDSTMRLLGPDGIMADEKDYAVHDTKAALIEAKGRGITPFCISIDKEGHDYLKAMCGDIGYEVVSSIESLPRRLPALYRRLTT